MDYKNLFKKYWFLITLAVLFIVFIGIYATDTFKNREVVKEPKEIDGQYIIYSINDEVYTADELYGELKNTYGVNSIYLTYDRLVCDEAIETTKEMKDIAASNAAYQLQALGEEKLSSEMKRLGFGDASGTTDYYIYLLKSQALRRNYLKEHMDEYVTPFVEENHPKMISHILVKVANVEKTMNEDGTYTLEAKPTEEEQAKLDTVLSALETENFADVALEYSDDGSAQQGGYLGYFDDKNATYVKEFADGARALGDGEVSDVVLSEYGYHIIKCDTSDINVMIDDINAGELMNKIFSANGNLYNVPLLEKAKELGIEIKDEKINRELMTIIGGEIETESEDAE